MAKGDRFGALIVRRESANRVIYDTVTGIEVVVGGGESRHVLAQKAADALASISERARHLLVSFMRDCGTFELSAVEVYPAKSDDGGDFSLRFNFIADHDPHQYGYTYFDVCFRHNAPPQPEFWPYKFTVGFH